MLKVIKRKSQNQVADIRPESAVQCVISLVLFSLSLSSFCSFSLCIFPALFISPTLSFLVSASSSLYLTP